MLEDNTDTYSLHYPDEKSYHKEDNTDTYSLQYPDEKSYTNNENNYNNNSLYSQYQKNILNCKNIDLFYNETIKNIKLYNNIHDYHINILNYFIENLDLISNVKYYNILELNKCEYIGKFFEKIKIGNFLYKKTYPGEYCYLNQKKVVYNFKIFTIIIKFTIFPLTNIAEMNIYKNYNQINNIKYKIFDNKIDIIIFYQLYNDDNYTLLTSFEKFKTSIYDIINENFTKNDYLNKIIPIFFDIIDNNNIIYYYNDNNFRLNFDKYIKKNMKKIIYHPMFINLFTILNVENFLDKDGNTFLHYAMFYNISHVIDFLCQNKNLFKNNYIGLDPIDLFLIAKNPNTDLIKKLEYYDISSHDNLNEKISHVIDFYFIVYETHVLDFYKVPYGYFLKYKNTNPYRIICYFSDNKKYEYRYLLSNEKHIKKHDVYLNILNHYTNKIMDPN